MVADGKSQGERGLIGRRAEQVVYGIEHVFVAGAPGADEGGILEGVQVVQVVEAVAQEEALHIVEVRFARSEEHTSELQSLMSISYAVFCLKKIKSITSLH